MHVGSVASVNPQFIRTFTSTQSYPPTYLYTHTHTHTHTGMYPDAVRAALALDLGLAKSLAGEAGGVLAGGRQGEGGSKEFGGCRGLGLWVLRVLQELSIAPPSANCPAA